MLVLERLGVEEFRSILLDDHAAQRKSFLDHFPGEIEGFVQALSRTHDRLTASARTVPEDKRSAWVSEFLFVALNNLLTAIHLLISGLPLPFGNLMRQRAEALATALLLSHAGTGVFEELERDLDHFPVHKAMDRVSRSKNARLLGVDKNCASPLSA